ncbi:hypothetical protein [Photorhabdus heterorhabditis]|uniref:hypothetical protein n=1 Tax=Photorhabdus heterorhabditis TaxID=880156 RepID=UPI00165F5344|nr:hypothetical protein [Photorhabdus heterorhabditis]
MKIKLYNTPFLNDAEKIKNAATKRKHNKFNSNKQNPMTAKEKIKNNIDEK